MKGVFNNLEIDFQRIGGALLSGGFISKEFGNAPQFYWVGVFSFVFGAICLGLKKKNNKTM